MERQAPSPRQLAPPDTALTCGNLEIRPGEYELLVDGRHIALTLREMQVLWALVERENRVVSRPEIYRGVWGGTMPHRDRAVDVFVRKVRIKLEAAAPDWQYVHTHFGIGYRFTPTQR